MPAIDFGERRDWFRALSRSGGLGFTMRCATGSRDGRMLASSCISRLRYLDQIVVDLDDWGKGVGKALIAEAKRLSPRGLSLDVNQDNPRAIAFYEKHGFHRLRAGRNPQSGRPTFRYGWGEVSGEG